MSTHKHFDTICCGVLAFVLILTLFFVNAERFDIKKAYSAPEYESHLFDTSYVHTVDIVMDNWDEFTANCKNEEYYSCAVVIDNKAYKNVAIRAKGNTSLTQVESYGNNRYSFKIEFNHYDSSKTYYGLDKLCLNNIIQDNTYMKDYLTYQMMAQSGVAAPLCSYTNITVNGEDWGLYLAVEGIEEAFLNRNYGSGYGELYKPDSTNTGGDRQNKTAENRTGNDDVLLKYIDDDPDSYPNIFDNAKTDISDDDKTRLIESLKNLSAGENITDVVDIESVIRYFTVHNFVLNFDSYTGSMIHNYYLYEKDGRMQMIPWDYNLAFGGLGSLNNAESLINYPIDTPVSGGSTSDRPMIAWIFEDENYTEMYHTCFSEFISEWFDSGKFENIIDSVYELISPYVKNDPTKFCAYDEFETGVSTLKKFCTLRTQSIKGQLDGSIGSTDETQKNSELISADGLQISDMGTMQNSANGGMNGPGRDNFSDRSEEGSEDNSTSTADENKKGGQMPPFDNEDNSSFSKQEPPEIQNRGEMPDGSPPDRPDSNKNCDFSPDFDNAGRENNPPDKNAETDTKQAEISAYTLISVAVSAAVLIFGIAFAFVFKRRKS